jgi:sarcosine oxidase delta subunit
MAWEWVAPVGTAAEVWLHIDKARAKEREVRDLLTHEIAVELGQSAPFGRGDK